jgi:hypothetical protein
LINCSVDPLTKKRKEKKGKGKEERRSALGIPLDD